MTRDAGQESRDYLATRAFVSVSRAAELLAVSEQTVRRLCRDGKLPAIRCGGEWRVELAALHRGPSRPPTTPYFPD